MKRSFLTVGAIAGAMILASQASLWGHGGGGGGFHGGGGGGGYHGAYGGGGYHGGYGGGGYHGGYGGYGGGYHGGYGGIGGYGGYGGFAHDTPIGPSMSRGYNFAPRGMDGLGDRNLGEAGLARPGEFNRPTDLPRQDFNRPNAGDVNKFLNMPESRGAGAAARPAADHAAANRQLSPEQRQNLDNRWSAANKNHPLNPANRDNTRAQNWANNVRDNFRNNHPDYQHWFGPGWWANHSGAYGWWYNRFGNRYPWGYWWGVPAWGAMTDWLGGAWGEPVPYYYGDDGNVTYEDDSVNFNGQPIGTPTEYNQSAYDIATQVPPATEDAADAPTDGSNWMPLGVFALSTNQEDQNPTRVLQLAVNKDGSIGGTYFNEASNAVLPVQGSVDRTTQRVCFTLGDDKQTVLETGLDNLTKDTAQVLIHFGNSTQETGELVRLQQPPSDATTTGSLPGNPQR